MNTQRLEEWIRQYLILKKHYEDLVWIEDNDTLNNNTADLFSRKKELLQTIIKEAKNGAFD